MAKSSQKAAKGKPISSHPLFPAVVALWFGALFGLGSLAIRPGLIESAVLKTGLDLIVPAAAPPLGVTARILIALVMASAGAVIGASLAWRMTRPATVVREPRRNAANPGVAAEAEAALWNSRNVHADGPARRPISAYDELGETLDGPNPLLSRRRALSMRHEAQPFEPYEFAPLPGGEPQIFDIAATRLAQVAAISPVEADPAPLDLGNFPALAQAEPLLAARSEDLATEPAQANAAAPQANLASLDMTDLAKRLQDSMARRRATKTEPVVDASAAPVEDAVTDEISADSELEPEDAAADEDAFASLLSIETPRQEFVRIDEPERTDAAIEPVVIFPGQLAAATFRPFDGPAAALPGAPVAPIEAAAAVDPADAERALRLALANLQRISGAA